MARAIKSSLPPPSPFPALPSNITQRRLDERTTWLKVVISFWRNGTEQGEGGRQRMMSEWKGGGVEVKKGCNRPLCG